MLRFLRDAFGPSRQELLSRLQKIQDGTALLVEELNRLRAIRAQVIRLIELLDKGEVDYDLVEEIKAVLNG